MDGLILLLGLVVLYVGGEFFVRGASRLAEILGMSSLLIGLTVVSFGTSAPELGVSLNATFSGVPEVAIGNVVGSNLFNTLVILGFCALTAPLVVSRQLVRLDVPVMIGASLLMGAFALNGVFSRIEGFIFLAALIVYSIWLFKTSKEEPNGAQDESKHSEEVASHAKEYGKILLFLALGLVGLYFGSRWTVNGAVAIAQAFNISERVIAITIISAGTSLPELATSIVATIKGERDIAIGNVVGSNIMNVFLILSLTSIIYPHGIEVSDQLKNLDIPVAIVAALLCFPFFLRDTMTRKVGAFFLALYAGYLVILF